MRKNYPRDISREQFEHIDGLFQSVRKRIHVVNADGPKVKKHRGPLRQASQINQLAIKLL